MLWGCTDNDFVVVAYTKSWSLFSPEMHHLNHSGMRIKVLIGVARKESLPSIIIFCDALCQSLWSAMHNLNRCYPQRGKNLQWSSSAMHYLIHSGLPYIISSTSWSRRDAGLWEDALFFAAEFCSWFTWCYYSVTLDDFLCKKEMQLISFGMRHFLLRLRGVVDWHLCPCRMVSNLQERMLSLFMIGMGSIWFSRRPGESSRPTNAFPVWENLHHRNSHGIY